MHYDYDREIFFQSAKEYTCNTCGKKYMGTYVYAEYSLKVEVFKHLKKTFDCNTLADYLPQHIKKSYQDAIDLIDADDLSNNVKIGAVSLLLIAFLEADVSNINFKELVGILHKKAEASLGVSLNKEKLETDPRYLLNTLEAMLNETYLIPTKKELLKQEFEEKNKKLEEKLNILVSNIKG
jgi:hypothetical protein